MLTTIGVCAAAIRRNVCASIVPVSGALFIGGSANDCAAEVGDRSSRDAITMPTAIDTTAIKTIEKSVSRLVDINASKPRFPGAERPRRAARR